MIGVIPKPGQERVVEEFFELFKTPWEFYRPGCTYDVAIASADEVPEVDAKLLVVYGSTANSIDGRIGIAASGRRQRAILSDRDTALPIYGDLLTFANSNKEVSCVTTGAEIAGVRVEARDCAVIRLGYDLFDQVRVLLSTGQSIEHAHIPTLDIHIKMLRDWILNEGIPLLEIPPSPAGHSFAVCLTHDIDFVGIRNHKFDHTMWGFVYRATAGAAVNLFRGRISMAKLVKSWCAVASLPLVYVGWLRDFWEPFEWYLEVEKGLAATYFLIPFKGRAGEQVRRTHPSWRAAAYDIDDLSQWIARLKTAGCELGAHGIDAWHSVEKGSAELRKIAAISGESDIGIRMHWLLQDANTISVLEQSGYAYDSTAGYNETIGYSSGTTQVFRPLSAKTLLEIPLHIQDGALFYPHRLDLSEPKAEKCCNALIENARTFGGVLTVLWHDRSHGPERFWGDFYVRFVHKLKSSDAWFATATQAVCWFRKRRQVRFERLAHGAGVRAVLDSAKEIPPPLNLRVYPASPRPSGIQPSSSVTRPFIDVRWDGKDAMEFDASLNRISALPIEMPAAEICR